MFPRFHLLHPLPTFLALAPLMSAIGLAQTSPTSEQFVPGRLLVQFRPGVAPDKARGVLSAFGARSTRQLHQIGVHVIELPASASETAYAHAFRGRPEVAFAELDRILGPDDVVPNDPYFNNQWQLKKIQAPAAWTTTTGSSNITIAIIDTGVDGTHPDLASQMVPGWNLYDNNPDSRDVYGHGTKVAGTAAAASNNGIGVASVAWYCRIMPVRVSATSGGAMESTIADGILWAADHGARVANVSYRASTSSTVTSAARYLQGRGGVLTVSAGNESTFDSSADNPYVLTVSGSDPNDVLYSWSNTGNLVDLAAPGCVGSTTIMGGGYGSVCGTSFSAPLTAGVAALVLSVNPGLTPADVTRILQQSADDAGAPGWDASYGWGRLNAAKAVSLAAAGGTVPDTQAPSVSITSPAPGTTVSGTVIVKAAANDVSGISSVTLAVNGTVLGTATSAPYQFAWDTTKVPNGVHTLTATAADPAGNPGAASISVTASNTADTTPPVVSIVSPGASAKISGTVTVSVSASDNVGVVKTDLYVDGVLAATSTQAPFSMRWNSKKAKAGAHSLLVKAYDAAANTGVSPIVVVTILGR